MRILLSGYIQICSSAVHLIENMMFNTLVAIHFILETSKYRYSVGTVYSYDYTGETASKIGGTSEEESRLHINAQAEFEVVSQCEFVLRVHIFKNLLC